MVQIGFAVYQDSQFNGGLWCGHLSIRVLVVTVFGKYPEAETRIFSFRSTRMVMSAGSIVLVSLGAREPTV